MFDIQQQKQAAQSEDAGTVVHIRDLDDEPMYFDHNGNQEAVTITIAGANSSQMRNIESAMRRRKFKPNKLTNESFHNDTIEKAAACTLDWTGFTSGGQIITCNTANALTLYKACPWVLDQVVEAQYDRARFSGSSSTGQ